MEKNNYLVPVYDSRQDKYYRIELDVALKNRELHLFHPLAENQPDIDAAIEDSKERRNPYMLADALFEELTAVFRFTHSELSEFIKRFFILTFPPGA